MRALETDLMPAMAASRCRSAPIFRSASGLLTGKYRRDASPKGTRLTVTQRLADRYLTDRELDDRRGPEALCKTRGRSMLELAFAWLAARPAVASVIAGATKPEQLEQNVKAVELKLSPSDIEEIDALSAPAKAG